MKKFEAPIMELEKLEIEDVISTSGCNQECSGDTSCPDDMGEF